MWVESTAPMKSESGLFAKNSQDYLLGLEFRPHEDSVLITEKCSSFVREQNYQKLTENKIL